MLAAILRAALGGWVKARRFQGISTCVLGCGGPDTIEHYAGCICYHALSSKFFGLSRPTAEHQLCDFIGLVAASTSWAHSNLDSGEIAALRAIAAYAMYRVQGSVRHGVARQDASELFRGFVRQATENHAKSRALVTRAFKRPQNQA